MQLSWTGLKISIAGAKLNHLVQKDKIWDYGSMAEQVKTVFQQLEKAKKKEQTDFLRNYLTVRGYEYFKRKLARKEAKKNESFLKNVSIIEVHVKNKKLPDRFCALIKGTKKQLTDVIDLMNSDTTKVFSEQWLFLRKGDWWLLDKMK